MCLGQDWLWVMLRQGKLLEFLLKNIVTLSKGKSAVKKFLRFKSEEFFVCFVKIGLFDVNIIVKYVNIGKTFFHVPNRFYWRNFCEEEFFLLGQWCVLLIRYNHREVLECLLLKRSLLTPRI